MHLWRQDRVHRAASSLPRVPRTVPSTAELCLQWIKLFREKIKEQNIRPHRPLSQEKDILSYRKKLIELVSSLREAGDKLTKKDHISIVNAETSEMMKLISQISKVAKVPTHQFDICVQDIDNLLEGLFVRADDVPQIVESKRILNKVNEKMIAGEQPTPELFRENFKRSVLSMEQFSQGKPGKLYGRSNGVFQQVISYLKNALNRNDCSPYQVQVYRKRLVNVGAT